ncbi:hypothetical protein BC827DRAFT_1174627 [Russula dissimulans]|nr:hypothetical protein BC827DRAFT_1174627 [Russula dissimulans]
MERSHDCGRHAGTWARDRGDSNSRPRRGAVKALTWGIASVSTNTRLTLHYSPTHGSASGSPFPCGPVYEVGRLKPRRAWLKCAGGWAR